eukprot:COSAG01_NODE_54066_length_334_cov_2.255319_1_plen_80_part_10
MSGGHVGTRRAVAAAGAAATASAPSAADTGEQSSSPASHATQELGFPYQAEFLEFGGGKGYLDLDDVRKLMDSLGYETDE